MQRLNPDLTLLYMLLQTLQELIDTSPNMKILEETNITQILFAFKAYLVQLPRLPVIENLKLIIEILLNKWKTSIEAKVKELFSKHDRYEL
jgi:hypothetical protein